jgi:hypothetical protein
MSASGDFDMLQLTGGGGGELVLAVTLCVVRFMLLHEHHHPTSTAAAGGSVNLSGRVAVKGAQQLEIDPLALPCGGWRNDA